MMAVSIHPAPPADHLVPPHGLAGPLPVRHPQPAPLPPKKGDIKQLNTSEVCSKANTCDYTQRLSSYLFQPHNNFHMILPL